MATPPGGAHFASTLLQTRPLCRGIFSARVAGLGEAVADPRLARRARTCSGRPEGCWAAAGLWVPCVRRPVAAAGDQPNLARRRPRGDRAGASSCSERHFRMASSPARPTLERPSRAEARREESSPSGRVTLIAFLAMIRHLRWHLAPRFTFGRVLNGYAPRRRSLSSSRSSGMDGQVRSAAPATDRNRRHRRRRSDRRMWLGAFAVALGSAFFVPGGWLAHAAVVVAVPLVGGRLIGRWSAVAVAVVSNVALSGVYLFARENVFRVTGDHDFGRVALILAAQSLVSVLATAVAVSWRRRVDARVRVREAR